MRILRYLIVLMFLMIGPSEMLGQEYNLAKFNRTRLRIERRSVQMLATWSIGNLIYNGFATKHSSTEDRYFHQTNVYWNVVNLGMAYYGFRHSFHQDPSEVRIYDSISEQRKVEQILYFSLGLDLAFIATGFYLQERNHDISKVDKLNGQGRSFVLQASVLLGFDLIQLILHKSNNQKLEPLIQQLQFGPTGLSFRTRF